MQGAWLWAPVSAAEAMGVGGPGPAGAHPAAWSETAPEQLSLSLRPQPPLPSSGNALGTELPSLGNFEEGKNCSLAWSGLFCTSLPQVRTHTLPVLGP